MSARLFKEHARASLIRRLPDHLPFGFFNPTIGMDISLER
jgi:hypothetical protein